MTNEWVVANIIYTQQQSDTNIKNKSPSFTYWCELIFGLFICLVTLLDLDF